MNRFLQDTDYDTLIKGEILKLINGSTPQLSSNYKLLKAEKMATDQIRNWLAGRVDCDKLLTPATGDEDTRDNFIIMLVIDLTLYHLYSQTPSKDVPEHRSSRYEDALTWLRQAGKGEISTNLPSAITEDTPGDVRIWSKPIDNDDW